MTNKMNLTRIILLLTTTLCLTAFHALGQTANDYLKQGSAKCQKGDLDGAIGDFDKALELKPGDAEILYYRGQAKYHNKDLPGAIADFTEVIRLNPSYAAAYNKRGIAKSENGDLDGAIADYNKAIELKPNYGAAYMNRGGAKLVKGDKEGAEADGLKAIQLDPSLSNLGEQSGRAIWRQVKTALKRGTTTGVG